MRNGANTRLKELWKLEDVRSKRATDYSYKVTIVEIKKTLSVLYVELTTMTVMMALSQDR